MRHKVCSLRRRRASRLDELVQINSISNPSGSSNEGLHERLEVVLLGIGNLDRCQLLFSHFLAVDTNQGQSHISAAPSRRLLPLLHSVRDFIKSSHQGLKIILEHSVMPQDRSFRCLPYVPGFAVCFICACPFIFALHHVIIS